MLIIFDLDGTLLNTLDDLVSATNYALHVSGFETRSKEECCQFVGNGVAQLLQRALPEGARTSKNQQRMQSSFFAYYDAHLTDQTFPYPGIEDTLLQLQQRGIKLAVASNKYQRATQHLIQHFFPQISFAAVFGQREGVPIKPNRQIVFDILEIAQEEKNRCLYVGDSDVDIRTARNAQVKVCGVTWGFRTREHLLNGAPDYLVDYPAEILKLVP